MIFSTSTSFAETNSESSGNSFSSADGSNSAGNSEKSGGSDSGGNSEKSGGSDSGKDSSSSGGEGSSGAGQNRVVITKSNGESHRDGNTWYINFDISSEPGNGGSAEKGGEGSASRGSGNIGQTGGGKFINPANLKKEFDLFDTYVTNTAQQIGETAHQDIESTLSREDSLEDQIKTSEKIIKNIEGRIRQSIQNPDVQLSYPTETKNSVEERKIQILTQTQEIKTYRYALQLIKNRGTAEQKHFNKTINNLKQEIDLSLFQTPLWGTGPPNKKKTLQLAMNTLKDKYDQRQLGLISESYISQSNDIPYTFISPQGKFLSECQKIYAQIQETQPFNEQGILAKEIALAAIETADQLFAQGETSSAQTALYIVEIISNITLGFMPYIGLGKDIYELFTGKHLLTGRTLTSFERSLSVGGIIFSLLTGGTFGPNILKLPIEKILGMINSTLLTKVLQGSADPRLTQAVFKYAKIIFPGN